MTMQTEQDLSTGYWNYRVINHGSWVGIHEVYYEKNGKLSSYTTDAVGVACSAEEGAKGLGETLAMMRRALDEPALRPEDFGDKRRKREKR